LYLRTDIDQAFARRLQVMGDGQCFVA
jgi:hypothetical protein